MNEPTGKRCPKCGVVKPLDQFHVARNKPDGRQTHCRECKRQWGKGHAQSSRDSARRYRLAHPEESKASTRRVHASARNRVFNHYGRACSCCGATERLEIDHVNGDGGGRRRATSSGTALYYWLIRNNFPDGFQTLCASCNKSKGTRAHCQINHQAA